MLATLRLSLFLFYIVGVDLGRLRLVTDYVDSLQMPVSLAAIAVIRKRRKIVERRLGN
jgi:hypothetical protein